jgi:hypothetical protein
MTTAIRTDIELQMMRNREDETLTYKDIERRARYMHLLLSGNEIDDVPRRFVNLILRQQ